MTSAHILIVDDEPEILDSVGAVLVASGYRVTAVENVELARGRLAECDDISLIVSDVWMPDETGIAFLRDLQNRAFGGLPVVLMTGSGSRTPIEVTAAIGELNGAFSTLVKPFSVEQLRAVVAAALQE